MNEYSGELSMPRMPRVVFGFLIAWLPQSALLSAQDATPAHPATHGPKHHFFGYYDVTPWDKTDRYVLANEIDFIDRQPKPGETLTVGMVDTKTGEYMPFDETEAWCWQMGARLQWLGSAPNRTVIYNTVRCKRYAATIRDVFKDTTQVLPWPIYAVSPDGKQAVTLDFDRLNRLRPGYGYCALPERNADDPAPKDMGIYAIDMTLGENKLIIPLAWAAANQPDERFKPGAQHWFNHLLFNPSGTRFLFLHRWQKGPNLGWWTRMYAAKPDGTDRQLLFDDGMVSHFDWKDDHTVLAWARTKEHGDRFYLLDIRTGDKQIVGDKVLTRDGHCSYSPDRRWILNDTYPDDKRLQTLMLYDPLGKRRIDLGKFYLSPKITGPFRCDLHPRWNRAGTKVAIDSAHTGERQVYVVDVGRYAKRHE
jgi:hypothetical protein